MRKLEPSVPHRLGRRANFIPGLKGRRATWANVLDTCAEPTQLAGVAQAAMATVLTADGQGQPTVSTADLKALSGLEPDQLYAVRRPVSYKGMTNYVARVSVPSERHGSKGVWCESFNELSHLRDLLLTSRPLQMTTQPFRLEWSFTTGVRSHVPDFLVRYAGGQVLLVDVTTTRKFEDPRLSAILRLTHMCARAMGWDYEVRTELPPQRVRNINFIHAGRHDVRQDRVVATRRLQQAHGRVDVHRASELLGGGPPGYLRLWDLTAHGFVHLPLDEPLDIDTLLAFAQLKGAVSWRHGL